MSRSARTRLLARLLRGSLHNVPFDEFVRLAVDFGFRVDRVSGSHSILIHSAIAEILTIQDWNGEAKPYQIRQFLRLVERYNLSRAEPE